MLETSVGTVTLGFDSHNLVVVFEDSANLLEVQALKAGSLTIGELHHIVLETPFATLEGHGLVDLGEESGDGQVFGDGARPDELDLRQAVPADR